MRLLLPAFLLLIIAAVSKAQTPCTALGQNPQTAFPVCGSNTFHQTTVPFCGDVPVATVAACGGGLTDKNPFWYKFTCFSGGTLGFLITPDNNNEDYDWQLYDITGRSYAEVYTNASLIVACNWSGSTGVTGTNLAAASLFECGGSTPIFSSMPTLIATHEYLLLISHWSNTPNGYTLSFGRGSAVITDPLSPDILSAATTCDNTHINVKLNKRILCSSIEPGGSDFAINYAGVTITAAASIACSNSFDTDNVTLTLSNPLPAGNYIVTMQNGIDGNTLLDYCSTPVPAGNNVPLTINAVNAVEVDTVTFTGCAPSVLNIKFTKPVFCNSITASGSEFLIQPGNILPSFVQMVCIGTSPSADMLQVNLAGPLSPGNYQLVISNGTDGNTFMDTCSNLMQATSIPFSINAVTPPVIQSFTYDECHRDRITVNFDKPIACASISSDFSEFRFLYTNGAATITNITSNCGASNYTTQITIYFSQNLAPQLYQLAIYNGIDGTTLSDTCFSFIPQGYSKTITTTVPPRPVFDSVQFDNCNPSFVKAFFSKPIKCNTVLASGWPQFSFAGPASYTGNIISATPDAASCAHGYTNWVIFQLSAPVITAGSYRLVAMNVGLSVTDTCDMPQVLFDNISFNMLGKPTAAFTSQVKFACVMDTIIFSHPGGNGINNWQWTFSDGSTATGPTVTKLFPVSTPTVNAQLIVSNGFCSDTVSNTITLGNAFKAVFTTNPKDTGCINTPISFTNSSIGNNLQYLWLFGDNTQFAGATPPPHVYTATNVYNVKLAVTDIYGCTDTASANLNITPSASIDFTGLPLQTCTDKTVSLVRSNISRYMYTYTWDNGDGITLVHQTHVQFRYPAQGVYTVTLSGTDRYCGTASVSKTINVFAVPQINLGNDTVLCPAVQLPIGVPFTNGYDYLWSNGASTPQILTDVFTSDYSLLVNNNGCQATDAVSVKVLPACLIKVPNAFTPNNDGSNDKLKAVNADLAKEFTLRVYNRFGQLLFVTNNPLQGWDGNFKGKGADAGSYVWQLSYVDPWSKQKVFESGTSILIR